MTSNELLQEKWKAQEILARIAGYNIKEMLDNAEKVLLEIQEKFGCNFRKSNRKHADLSGFLKNQNK